MCESAKADLEYLCRYVHVGGVGCRWSQEANLKAPPPAALSSSWESAVGWAVGGAYVRAADADAAVVSE